MKLVKHLLDAKGRKVLSISADASVFDAIKMMADESVGSLVVLDENGTMPVKSSSRAGRPGTPG